MRPGEVEKFKIGSIAKGNDTVSHAITEVAPRPHLEAKLDRHDRGDLVNVAAPNKHMVEPANRDLLRGRCRPDRGQGQKGEHSPSRMDFHRKSPTWIRICRTGDTLMQPQLTLLPNGGRAQEPLLSVD